MLKKCSNKKCSHNGIPQPLANFSKNPKSSDGYNNWCKDCQKKYQEENAEILSKKSKQRKNKPADFNHYHDKLILLGEKFRRDPDNENYIQILSKQNEWFTPTYQQIQDRIKSYNKYSKRFVVYSENFAELLIKFEEEVRRDPNNQNLLQIRCKNSKCRKWFNPTNSQLQSRFAVFNGRRSGGSYFYCSDKCKDECILYNMQKDPYDNKKTESEIRNIRVRKDIDMIHLSQMVFERDKYTCCECHKSLETEPDLKLVCHHVLPVKIEPMFASDMDNCQTLCEDCHIQKHKISGCKPTDLNKICE